MKIEAIKLTRAQMREMRKAGFDLVRKAFQSQGEQGVPFTGDELDILLDIGYPGRVADLETMGLGEQMELASATITATFARSEELKN
jgi:hypothetical protein